jgi:hypothetical protein
VNYSGQEQNSEDWFDLLNPMTRMRPWLLFFAFLSFAVSILIGISMLIATDFVNLHRLLLKGVSIQNLVFTIIVTVLTVYICWLIGVRLFKASRFIYKARESSYFMHLKEGLEQLRAAMVLFGVGVVVGIVLYLVSLFGFLVLIGFG